MAQEDTPSKAGGGRSRDCGQNPRLSKRAAVGRAIIPYRVSAHRDLDISATSQSKIRRCVPEPAWGLVSSGVNQIGRMTKMRLVAIGTPLPPYFIYRSPLSSSLFASEPLPAVCIQYDSHYCLPLRWSRDFCPNLASCEPRLLLSCDENRLHCSAHQQMLSLKYDPLSCLKRHRDFVCIFTVVVIEFLLFEAILGVSPELHQRISNTVQEDRRLAPRRVSSSSCFNFLLLAYLHPLHQQLAASKT